MIAFVTAALAASFTSSDTPASMDWEYTYSVFPVTGDTEFTFTDTSVDTSTDMCALTGLCMDGDFTTSDKGEGPFATSAIATNCTPSPPPPPPQMLVEVVPRVCDVEQEIALTYVYNGGSLGPTYEGVALAGQLSEFEVYLCVAGNCMSFGFFGQTFLQNAQGFDGDITFGTLGVVGTFIEL